MYLYTQNLENDLSWRLWNLFEITLYDICFAWSIPLGDVYLKEHPELRNELEEKIKEHYGFGASKKDSTKENKEE